MHTTRPFHNHFHKAISVICCSLTINCKLIFLVNIVTALHDGCFILMWVRPIHQQLSRGLLRKRCSENIQQIYRRTPILKCDYNKVAMQLYWNHTCSVWVYFCKFAAPFPKKNLWTAAFVYCFKTLREAVLFVEIFH